jgi:hypothetical protein
MRRNPITERVSRLDGRSGKDRKVAGEESPGSTDERCRITSGGGDPRDSATENRPPRHAAARVKRCGKSAPRCRQRQRHGKPHREQNRIGTARGAILRIVRSSRSGRLPEAPSNRRPRGMAVTRGENCALQNPAYRPADALQGGSAGNRRAPANFTSCRLRASPRRRRRPPPPTRSRSARRSRRGPPSTRRSARPR